jgi:DNA-binding NarL/FixJ family response regulator
MKQIKIIIVDDHQIMIDGLLAILQREENIKVVGVALNGLKALELAKNEEIDIVLTDISMPEMSGVQLTKEIKKYNKNIQVIALSMFNDSHNINQMLEAGISGYLLKNTGNEELMTAINKVYNGGIYYSEEVSDLILKNYTSSNQKRVELEKVNITDREREIIILITKEYSNAQIASELFISERTVETHRKNIYRKNNTNNIVGLIKFAYEHNILEKS